MRIASNVVAFFVTPAPALYSPEDAKDLLDAPPMGRSRQVVAWRAQLNDVTEHQHATLGLFGNHGGQAGLLSGAAMAARMAVGLWGEVPTAELLGGMVCIAGAATALGVLAQHCIRKHTFERFGPLYLFNLKHVQAGLKTLGELTAQEHALLESVDNELRKLPRLTRALEA